MLPLAAPLPHTHSQHHRFVPHHTTAPRPSTGQKNLYFSLPAIVGWLGTAFLHAALIVIMVLLGADSLDSDSSGGHPWSLLRNGLLMFTIVIITVHLQLAIVIDQWTWIHHLAIWGSIGRRQGGGGEGGGGGK